MESISNNSGKSRQTMQPYLPVWMAHWMRPSSDSKTERHDDFARGNKELDCVSKDEDSTIGLEASRSVKEAAMVDTKTHSSLKHQYTDEIQAIRPFSSHNLERGRGGMQFPAAKGAPLREYHSISEGISKNPLGWVETHASAKDRNSATSMPFQEIYLGCSTHLVPYQDLGKHEFDKGKAVMCPLVSRPSTVSNSQYPNSNLRIVEQEHGQKHGQSTGFVCERKMGSQLESDASINASFSKYNTSLVLDAPSMNQNWFQNMQNCSGIPLLPNQCITSEKNDSRISNYDHYSLHKLPNGAHDMKTMRICTTVDSVEAMPGGIPRFSQTTHSLLITKKTEANVSKDNDIFRSLITKMSENSSTDPQNVPAFFGQANRGVKLQPLSSSSNSEGQGDVRNIRIGTSKVAIKNESSAETDTMDMDFLKERPNYGANSTRSIKGFNSDTKLSPLFDVGSSREVEHLWTSTGIPHINLELPALPAAASSSDNAGPTSSRTQSLEMDTLLAHAEHPTPKSNLFLDDSPKADPTTRWVKRLKLSSSDSSSRGTKSSNLAENPSYNKKRKFFRSVLKDSITGKETSLSDRSIDLSKEDEHITVDPTENDKELLLSHTWIKRWLRNRTRKKPQAPMVREPQSLKLSVDDLQKKQFPSIAAMALMGKAMGGFQSCELQKRGPLTVWNSKAF